MQREARIGTRSSSTLTERKKGVAITRSIRWQLVSALIVSQLLLAGGLLCLAVYFTHRQLRSAFDAGLRARAMSVAALVRYSEGPNPTLMFANEFPTPVNERHRDLFEVRSSDGKIVARSPDWREDLEDQARNKRQHWNARVEGRPYRAIRLDNVPVLDRESEDRPLGVTLTILYAASTTEMDERVTEAGIYIASGSFLLLVATVTLALWGIGRGLAPLRDLAASAGSVGAHNWKFQMPTTALKITELVPLAQAMTTMVDSLREAFTQQGEFIANAAHELRTPVTALKTNLELLSRKRRTVDEYREGIEDAKEDVGRLEHLVQSMLRLARAEQRSLEGVLQNTEIVDVGLTCEVVMERLAPFARDRHVSLSYSGDEIASVRARNEDLELVWSNLLQNAIRYSPSESCIQVRVQRTRGGFASVIVEDHGPGIPADELPHIFERFHRGDPSRARQTGGFGLGLAIVKTLVEAYGGTVEAESHIGEGTRMVVTLPTLSR